MPLILDLDVGDWVPMISNITEDSSLNISVSMGKDNQYIIVFSLCKEEYLSGEYKCADNETREKYFGIGGNSLYTNIEFTTINPSTFES